MKYCKLLLLLLLTTTASATVIPPGSDVGVPVYDKSIKASIYEEKRELLVVASPKLPYYNIKVKKIRVIVDAGNHVIATVKVFDTNMHKCDSSVLPNTSRLVGEAGFKRGYQGMLYVLIDKPCLLRSDQKGNDRQVNLNIVVGLYNYSGERRWFGTILTFDRTNLHLVPNLK